jgi:hypothetical protein
VPRNRTDQRWAVDVEGLREFQADVRKVQPKLKTQVPRALGKAAEDTVLPAARRNTPIGPGPQHLRDSLRVSKLQTGPRIVSRLPYARTVEYGLRHPVYARGDRADWTWVRQRRVGMVQRALVSEADDLVEHTWDELRSTFRRNGWPTA